MIKIVVTEDHASVLESYIDRLAKEADFEIVGGARNTLEALRLLSQKETDVLLTDLYFIDKGSDGLALIKEAKKQYPLLKILAMTGYDTRLIFQEVIELKANGCFCKTESMSDLISAIRIVYEGGEYQSPQVAEFLEAHTPIFIAPLNLLSSREKEVLMHVEKSYAEISKVLNISTKTVEKHIANAKTKTNCHTKGELVQFAIQNGLLKPRKD